MCYCCVDVDVRRRRRVFLRALTGAILRHDFALDFEMPLDRLCPPVPQRFRGAVLLNQISDRVRGTG
jgi:23S rRNA A1618 N6-methylase RlmF